MGENTFVFAPHVLYFDRIRWFPDARTEIHPKYIQNTVGYTGYCIHRPPEARRASVGTGSVDFVTHAELVDLGMQLEPVSR